jgi:hypothetical protein
MPGFSPVGANTILIQPRDEIYLINCQPFSKTFRKYIFVLLLLPAIALTGSPVSAEIKATLTSSTLNTEARLQAQFDTTWRMFQFSASPDVSMGTEGFYSTELNNWSNENLLKRSIFTANNLYFEMTAAFFKVGAGIQTSDFGAVEEHTALDLTPIDALELDRPRNTGQPTVWGGFDFDWLDLMAAWHYQGAGKVPWDKDNSWRPRIFGDKDIMDPHGGNESVNYTLWGTHKTENTTLRLLYYKGASPYATVQIGNLNGETAIEPDWHPIRVFSGTIHKETGLFTMKFGGGYIEREEWKDNTIDAELAVSKEIGNLQLKLQTIQEFIVKSGSRGKGKTNNNYHISSEVNLGRLYSDTYKFTARYTLNDYEFAGSTYLSDSFGWQIRPSAKRHFGKVTVGVEAAVMDEFYDPYADNNQLGVFVSSTF